MVETITAYWKRGSETESEPSMNAFKKEGEVRTYLGVSIPGGRKFVIPDIEENQELVNAFDGKKWSIIASRTVAPEPVPEPEAPKKRGFKRKAK